MRRLASQLTVALAPLLALGLAAVPAAALACTPPPGYRVPTNLELARVANTIVLGEVVAGGKGTVLDPDASTITVHPLAALKGLLPGANITLAGMSLAQPGDAAANTLSDPLAFGDPHPPAVPGECLRTVFPPGAQAVFFLRRENGAWVPAGGPYSRWAEDVAGVDAPWVQLANLYAQASLLPPEQAREKLEERHAALADRRDDPRAVATAADLERSLAGPSAPLVAALPSPSDETAATGAGEAVDDSGAVERALDAFGE